MLFNLLTFYTARKGTRSVLLCCCLAVSCFAFTHYILSCSDHVLAACFLMTKLQIAEVVCGGYADSSTVDVIHTVLIIIIL